MLYNQKYCVDIAQKYKSPIMWLPFFVGQGFLFIYNSSLVIQLYPNKDFLIRDDTRFDEFSKMKFQSVWSVGNDNTWPLISINGDKWAIRRKFSLHIYIYIYIFILKNIKNYASDPNKTRTSNVIQNNDK